MLEKIKDTINLHVFQAYKIHSVIQSQLVPTHQSVETVAPAEGILSYSKVVE